MKGKKVLCPKCGTEVALYENPVPTVDIIIEMEEKRKPPRIVLVYRKNEPRGWSLPGGFVDYGEALEQAALREAKEETGLSVDLREQFHTYSDPKRDPRRHTISTVFLARAQGMPRAGDDAADLGIFEEKDLPSPLVFDHGNILRDYFASRPSPQTSKRREERTNK